MKGCVMAGAVLILILVSVMINGFYVRNTSEELLAAAENLPSIPDPVTTPTAIQEMRKLLERNEPILGITVPYSIINGVSEALIRLEACALMGDNMQYAEIRALFGDLIRELARNEKLLLQNIL